MSYSLQLHGLQHIRLPYPPRVCSSSCLLSQWCCLTISFTVSLFFCLPSSPASGSFSMSQFFASGGQSTGASASASVLPMNIQDWFPLGFTGLISLKSKGLTRVFFDTTVQCYSSTLQFNSSVLSFLYNAILTSIHNYWKNHSFD